LIAKAIQGLVAALKPITAVLPAYVQFGEIIAALVIITICFIAGLIVRTGPGLRAKKAFEGAVLERLPGYTLLRGLAGRFTGRGDEPTFAPALVEIEEALVPALMVVYGAGAIGADTNGGSTLHPATRACASCGCPLHRGAQGVPEVGNRCWRVCSGDAAKKHFANCAASQLVDPGDRRSFCVHNYAPGICHCRSGALGHRMHQHRAPVRETARWKKQSERVRLFPGDKEADVTGHSSRILKDLGLQPEAERSQVLVPEIVSSLGSAFQSLFPIGLRVVDPSTAIAAQLIGEAVDLNFGLSGLGGPVD
jgi:hypothetical protein